MKRATLPPDLGPGRPRPWTALDLLVPTLWGVFIGFPLGYLSAGPKGGKALWDDGPPTAPAEQLAPGEAHDRKPSNTATPVPKQPANRPLPKPPAGPSGQRIAPPGVPSAAVRPVCKPGDLLVEDR